MLTVVIRSTVWPRLRASVRALRKTSGMITAEPRFRYTPPSKPATTAANVRKSRSVPSPSAAPSTAGCMWMMSVPIATCTVTGRPSRTPAASRLVFRFGKRRSSTQVPNASPMPRPLRTPRVIASLRRRPVSSAIPKRPVLISVSTSSEVWPIRASSKSWMMTAPVSARAVMTRRSIRSTSTGLRPTFVGCAPMPTTTGLPARRALTIASVTSRSVLPARMSGSPPRKSATVPPGFHGRADSPSLTLLCRLASGYVLILWRASGLTRGTRSGGPSRGLFFPKKSLVDELAEDMAERNVRLLDTGDHGAGDDEGMVHEVDQLAAGPAGPADRHEPLCLRRLHALQDVRGVAAGTDADRHVARMAQRLDLSGEDFGKVVVVGDAGELRLVRRKRDRRQRLSLAPV